MTRLKKAVVAIAGALAALPAAAEAQMYAGFAMGVAKNEDVTASGSGQSYKSEFDTAFDLTQVVSAGYQFDQLKVEGELGLRTGKISSTNSVEGGGSIGSHSIMGNAIYEFMPNSEWHPFVGAGVGYAFLNASGTKQGPNTVYQGNDWAFAYQGFAGISYDIMPSMAVSAQYRYFSTVDWEVATRNGQKMDADYGNHALMVGMAYKFGK